MKDPTYGPPGQETEADAGTPLDGASPTKGAADVRQEGVLRSVSDEIATAEVEVQEIHRAARERGPRVERRVADSRRELERLLIEARRLMSEIRASRSNGAAPLVPYLDKVMEDVRRYLGQMEREVEDRSGPTLA